MTASANKVFSYSFHPVFFFPFYKGSATFHASVMDVTGDFEITESGGLVASGKISVATDPVVPSVAKQTSSEGSASSLDLDLTMADVYKELRLRGYDYGSTFRGVLSASSTGVSLFRHTNLTFLPVIVFTYMVFLCCDTADA